MKRLSFKVQSNQILYILLQPCFDINTINFYFPLLFTLRQKRFSSNLILLQEKKIPFEILPVTAKPFRVYDTSS